MTEESTPYQVPSSQHVRETTMKSFDFSCTMSILHALLASGNSYEDADDLVDHAIAIKESLIEKMCELPK